MANAHFEDDAQVYHTIDVSQFNDKFDPTVVRKLRIHLYQPSPLWRVVDLQQITCYSVTQTIEKVPKMASPIGKAHGNNDKIKATVSEMMHSWRQIYSSA